MTLHPFDPKTVLFAKHAQHVVLIHFPIALYLSGTLFDFLARAFPKAQLSKVAHWNFLFAAVMSIPTIATGLLAWHFALDDQPLKGILRTHLILGVVCGVSMWVTSLLRARFQNAIAVPGNPYGAVPAGKSGVLLGLEAAVCILIGLTAHLGGFLSGVNV
jgi:uncharacterized membrane protein